MVVGIIGIIKVGILGIEIGIVVGIFVVIILGIVVGRLRQLLLSSKIYPFLHERHFCELILAETSLHVSHLS